MEVAGCLPAMENHHYPRGAVLGGEGLGLSVLSSVLLGLYQGREIVGHMVNLCLISEQLSSCLESGRIILHILSAMYDFLDFSTSLPTLVTFLSFNCRAP